MKKLFVLLFAFTTVVITSSCEKENNVNPTTEKVAPVISEGKRELGRWD